jgi:hypothetical protein
VLLAPAATGPKFSGTPITLEDYLVGNLSGLTVDTIWLTDKLLAYKDSHHNLWAVIFEDDKINKKLLSDNSPFKESERPRVSLWVPSFNTEYIAFGYGAARLYRYSQLAFYNISLMQDTQRTIDYPVRTQKSVNVTQKLRLFEWNPIGHDFVFVFENNIYYRSKPDEDGDATQITTTGTAETENVINGVTDWLYEEEILGQEKALWWSPDGEYCRYDMVN